MINDTDVMIWSGRTQEDKNKERISLLDFYKNELYYDEALQRALDYGGTIFIPDGDYRFLKKVSTSKEGVFIYGSEKAKFIWDKYNKENNILEDVCIEVAHSNFSVNGITLKYNDNETARTLVKIINVKEEISDFNFFRVKFLNGFYAVRAGYLGLNNIESIPVVRNLTIDSCLSFGRISGKNCGHFLTSNGDNIKYINNMSVGGLNTSSFGVNFSSNIIIMGNIEKDIARKTIAYVEASAQIEDCKNANAIISNNLFSHDIWISGSSDTLITNNKCHTLRVSVGNPKGFDVERVIFDNNYCSRIQVVKYGSYDINETYSALFKNNIIDPENALKLNMELPSRAITIQGGEYGKLIELYNNKVVSHASSYQASVVRGEQLVYLAKNNDYGEGEVLYSSTGGYVEEENTINPVFGQWSRNPNSYIGFSFMNNPTIGAINYWVNFDNIRKERDLNDELNNNGEAIIKFKRKGSYKLRWSIGLSSEQQVNFKMRLFDIKRNIEISRLIQDKIYDLTTLKCGEINFVVLSGDEIALQFYTDSINLKMSTDILLTNFSIEKMG